MSSNRVFPPIRSLNLHNIFRKKGINGRGGTNNIPSKRLRKLKYDPHHLVPVSRIEELFPGRKNYDEETNIIKLPVNYHNALHTVVDNLTLNEIIILFLTLYSIPGKTWTGRALDRLIEDIQKGKYVLEGDYILKERRIFAKVDKLAAKKLAS